MTELYEQLFNDFRTDPEFERYAHFVSMCGEQYNKGTRRFMLIGRATNGWGTLTAESAAAFGKAAQSGFDDHERWNWIEAIDGTLYSTHDQDQSNLSKRYCIDKKPYWDYQEMAEHYGTAIIPARVRKPKDKPNAEGTVGVISTWIIAALRNEKFFTFEELNKAIREKLDKFNAEPFQKKEGSRFSAFVNEEKPFLLPLPASAYEMAVWATATIQADYLITVGNVKYSVPFDLIGQKVDIRYTSKTVEVFFHGNRMASHIRRHGVVDPIVIPEHMPENHRRYLEQGKDTYLKWASGVGPATETVMKAILGAHKVEQQSYRACGSLMKLSDRYSVARIEYACSRALQYTPSPSIKNIQTILKTGQDKVKPEKSIPTVSGKYGFTRGADYFGGGDQND